MRINWVGLVVFAAFCVALVMVVSRPAWMPLGEAAATILILLALAGLLVPRTRPRDV